MMWPACARSHELINMNVGRGHVTGQNAGRRHLAAVSAHDYTYFNEFKEYVLRKIEEMVIAKDKSYFNISLKVSYTC